MILLDTNVISEIVRRDADVSVLQWVRGQQPTDLYLSTVTAAELLYGVARLPAGRRKSILRDAIGGVIDDDFAGRILSFDLTAALHYATIAAACEQQGRRIGTAEGQIAAVCAAHGATLATRNVKDFRRTGISLVNPWQPREQRPR